MSIQVAGGSFVGRDHRVVGKNNQDAWWIGTNETGTVCLAADGCGSGAHSEVGAKLAVQIVGSELLHQLSTRWNVDWRGIEQILLDHIHKLAQAMGGSYRQVLEENFLFTLLGLVITNEYVTFFHCGDGTIVLNGAMHTLGPYSGNMPPYITYRLMDNAMAVDQQMLGIAPSLECRTDALESFLIGTDGTDAFRLHHDQVRPGLAVPVGDLSQFWQNDRYFRGNPELISRELKLIGRDWPHHNPQPGLLHDDTTIIVGKRTLQ